MDLSRHTSLAGLAEAIKAVEEAASHVGSELYVTGGMARVLWLEFGYGIDTGRTTEDVDFAVECADWPTFEDLAQELELRKLVRDERVQHRFRHPNGTEIDVLPFGGVENTNRTLAWPPDGNPVMNLVGFAEVADSTARFELPNNISVRVVTPAALAVLKLLAWEDRRGGPAGDKDAQDLIVIGEHYLEVREPPLSTGSEAELLERNRFENRFASAELLGSDMARFDSVEVRQSVVKILKREADPEGPLALARIVSSYEPIAAVRFIRALLKGFSALSVIEAEP